MAVFQGLAMLFFTPTTYPGQGTAQAVQPSVLALVVRSRTLTYAPWACPVDAVGCTAAALAAKAER